MVSCAIPGPGRTRLLGSCQTSSLPAQAPLPRPGERPSRSGQLGPGEEPAPSSHPSHPSPAAERPCREAGGELVTCSKSMVPGRKRVRYRVAPQKSHAEPTLTCRALARRCDALAAVWYRTSGSQSPSPRATPLGPPLGPAYSLSASPTSACAGPCARLLAKVSAPSGHYRSLGGEQASDYSSF